jgi:hypothetical protein
LATVFGEQYHFEVVEELLKSTERPLPQDQLAEILLKFLNKYVTEDTLYIIYYAGHGWTKHDPNKLVLGE